MSGYYHPATFKGLPAIIPPTQRVEQRVANNVPTLQCVTKAPPIIGAPNPTARRVLKLTNRHTQDKRKTTLPALSRPSHKPHLVTAFTSPYSGPNNGCATLITAYQCHADPTNTHTWGALSANPGRHPTCPPHLPGGD